MRGHSMWALAALATAIFALPSRAATTAAVDVGTTMNIYGAGHATAPGPGGAGGGILPFEIAIPAGTDRTVEFNLSGTVDYGGCCPPNGPDGIPITGGFYLPQYNGLAGCDFATRSRFLLAVFLDDSEPADPPPDSLVFSTTAFTELSPGLRQIFFVGDGLTGEGTGTTQVFHIPDGATRLFIGYSDRCSTSPNVPGWFSDNSGTVTGAATFEVTTAAGDGVPHALRLGQNFPNPFNPSTTITFESGVAGMLDLGIYDVRGRRVRTLMHGSHGRGIHTVYWDGRDDAGQRVSAGVYYYRLRGPEATSTRKMVLLR